MGLLDFFFKKHKGDEELALIRFVIRRFGYRPIAVEHFVNAVTHKSFANINNQRSNERLEFLGDAVLDTVIAEYLYNKFPGYDEGQLTKIKSKLVNRKTLSEIAEEMEIREVLRYNSSRTVNIHSLEGNAFEAIIGAIYLDGGFGAAKLSIEKYVLRNYVDINRVLEEEIDFKSKLFIFCQRKKLELEMAVIDEKNVDGIWTYSIVTRINNKEYGLGSGSSKKIAEQAASKETLELLGVI